MIIDNVRLPIDVERGARGGPQFNTTVNITDGGVVNTNQNWTYPLYVGTIGYGLQARDNFEQVVDFFWARRGRLRGFLFRDWSDYEMELELLGTGDGVNRDFQCVKIYADDVLPFTRPITRPIESTMTVYVNDVAVPGSHWSLLTGGIVRFTLANTPVAAATVKVSGEFNIPCRFMSDTLEVEMEVWNAGGIPSIPIMEVRE
jgi:uncharacterized protein (TIGR02217 family)